MRVQESRQKGLALSGQNTEQLQPYLVMVPNWSSAQTLPNDLSRSLSILCTAVVGVLKNFVKLHEHLVFWLHHCILQPGFISLQKAISNSIRQVSKFDLQL